MRGPSRLTNQSRAELLEVAGGVSIFFTVVPALLALSGSGVINNSWVLLAVWLVLTSLVALTVWRFARWGIFWKIAAVIGLLVSASVVVVPTKDLFTPESALDETNIAGPDTSDAVPDKGSPTDPARPSCLADDNFDLVFAYENGTNSVLVRGDEIEGYRLEGSKQPNVSGENLVYLDETRRQISLANVIDGEPIKSRILENRVASPSVSMEEPIIVFVEEADAAWRIKSWNPDNDEIGTLYSSKVEIPSVKVSPSGEMIVWQERTSDGYRILVSDIQQIGPRELFEGDVNDPAWSIDSTQIAFAGKRADGHAIHTIPVEGGVEPVQRTIPNSATDRQPSWSPDCNEISFVRITAEESDLWVIDLETGQEVQNPLSGIQGHPSYGLVPSQ